MVVVLNARDCDPRTQVHRRARQDSLPRQERLDVDDLLKEKNQIDNSFKTFVTVVKVCLFVSLFDFSINSHLQRKIQRGH